MQTFRKWCRLLHRHLSYLFSGVLIVYLISGIAMNHKDTFNSQYDITVTQYTLSQPLPSKEDVDKKYIVENILRDIDEEKNYTKHYYPNDSALKIFLKSGSNIVVNTHNGQVTYEKVRRRPVLGAMSRLHYNPGRAWTIFSDIFAISMLIVIVTGLFMMKGKNGIIGTGGVELLLGIAIPIVLYFS